MDTLELFKQLMTASVYPESAYQIEQAKDAKGTSSRLKNFLIRTLRKRDKLVVKKREFVLSDRIEGKDWPMFGYTMVGHKRLDNIQDAVESILDQNIPGDLIECGVWRGGCAMLMKAVLEQKGDTDRQVWLADSFAGLPKPNAEDFPDDTGYDLSEEEILAVPVETVKANFERFGLLDDRVKFLPGWFKDTLPDAEVGDIALLRADGDLYESTMQILENLYPKVVSGGYVVIDDYNSWPPCKKAVEDYRKDHGITSPIVEIDWTGAYWIKE